MINTVLHCFSLTGNNNKNWCCFCSKTYRFIISRLNLNGFPTPMPPPHYSKCWGIWSYSGIRKCILRDSFLHDRWFFLRANVDDWWRLLMKSWRVVMSVFEDTIFFHISPLRGINVGIGNSRVDRKAIWISAVHIKLLNIFTTKGTNML